MQKVRESYKDLDGISEKLTTESTQGILDGFSDSWGPQFPCEVQTMAVMVCTRWRPLAPSNCSCNQHQWFIIKKQAWPQLYGAPPCIEYMRRWCGSPALASFHTFRPLFHSGRSGLTHSKQYYHCDDVKDA